ncbi:MAG: caspase family protein [Oscillatoria sp. SIO1A7]|nr:caspase family protein [Oscillatoria sp. SIO1A7]
MYQFKGNDRRAPERWNAYGVVLYFRASPVVLQYNFLLPPTPPTLPTPPTPPSPPMTFNSGYALAIAPGSYKNAPRLDVPITIEDVREVADVLGNERYCGYPKDRIVVLEGAEATRQKILDALDRLADLGEGDTLLLFYSGHGECGEDRRNPVFPETQQMPDRLG